MGMLWTYLTLPGTTWITGPGEPDMTPPPVLFVSLKDMPRTAFLPLPTAPAPIGGVETIGGA